MRSLAVVVYMLKITNALKALVGFGGSSSSSTSSDITLFV